VRGSRSGLASHRVAPRVLSGAALGHDRVRDGTGWGQRALDHGYPSPPKSGVSGGGFPHRRTLNMPRFAPSASITPTSRFRQGVCAGVHAHRRSVVLLHHSSKRVRDENVRRSPCVCLAVSAALEKEARMRSSPWREPPQYPASCKETRCSIWMRLALGH
jgi:hypothetical protein